MATSPFSRPSGAGDSPRIVWTDLEGSLLIVEPESVEHDVQTGMGQKDAVRAAVHVLDGPHAGEEYPDTLIFPRALQGQLSRQLGAKVLGRLGKGVAKPGQSAPWVLDYASEEDEEVAAAWLAARSKSPFVADDDLEAPF